MLCPDSPAVGPSFFVLFRCIALVLTSAASFFWLLALLSESLLRSEVIVERSGMRTRVRTPFFSIGCNHMFAGLGILRPGEAKWYYKSFLIQIIFLWSIYPVVRVMRLGGILTPLSENIIYTILDLMSKFGFCFQVYDHFKIS